MPPPLFEIVSDRRTRTLALFALVMSRYSTRSALGAGREDLPVSDIAEGPDLVVPGECAGFARGGPGGPP